MQFAGLGLIKLLKWCIRVSAQLIWSSIQLPWITFKVQYSEESLIEASINQTRSHKGTISIHSQSHLVRILNTKHWVYSVPPSCWPIPGERCPKNLSQQKAVNIGDNRESTATKLSKSILACKELVDLSGMWIYRSACYLLQLCNFMCISSMGQLCHCYVYTYCTCMCHCVIAQNYTPQFCGYS